MIPTGVEPVISWMRTKCPRPLDDGTIICNGYFTMVLNSECSTYPLGPISVWLDFEKSQEFVHEDGGPEVDFAIDKKTPPSKFETRIGESFERSFRNYLN